MATTCPNCGTTKNPPSAAFCSVCSTSLSKSPSGLAPVASLSMSGGRKYVLSLSAPSLVGSRGCAILLSGVGIQPQHAKLSPSGRGFLIEPLMGAVQVNGKSISAATPLQSGTVIKIGSQSLTYVGPGAPVASLAIPLPKALSKWKPKFSLPKMNLKPFFGGIKSIVSPAPKLDGHILMVDGPHMEQPDLEWAGLLVRIIVVLFLLLPLFIILLIFMPNVVIPFVLYGLRPGANTQVPARYLRVQDSSSRQHIVKMKGDLMWGMLSQGDDAQFWGRWQGGNLVMEKAMNKATNSEVMLKTSFQRRAYWAVLIFFFLCLLGNVLLPILASIVGY